jgi:CelD/BcsL family acetyltransferase involved in cellulose biosynthesis
MIQFAGYHDAALQVTEYNSFAELQGLRTQWAALVDQTRNATFFQHFDWLETYWQHYGQNQRLRVLVVSQNNQPIGILPLVVRQRSLGWGSARVLAYPLDDWGTFYGPIGPEPLATLRAGLKHIAQTQRDWDFVELGWVASETGDEGRTGAALAAAGLAGERSFYDSVAIVDLVGTWHEYLAARPNRFRSKLAAAERKLAGRGKVTYVRFRPEPAGDGPVDYRWDLYDACVEISRQSWQADSDNGTTMCHEQVSNYLRDAHMAAVRAGCCDLNILFVDGRPAAFMYCYTYRGRVFGLRRGFDASVARDGLGTVLCARMLEDSFARGDREVDMGASYLESKRVWMTRLVPSDRYTHFPSRKLKAQIVRFHRAARGWLSNARGESAVGNTNPKAVATRT